MSHLDKHDIHYSTRLFVLNATNYHDRRKCKKLGSRLSNGHNPIRLFESFWYRAASAPDIMIKIRSLRPPGRDKDWSRAWLCGDRKQTVVAEGDKSAPATVKSGVPQRTVLGLVHWGSLTYRFYPRETSIIPFSRDYPPPPPPQPWKR